jgi:hypothetical protein
MQQISCIYLIVEVLQIGVPSVCGHVLDAQDVVDLICGHHLTAKRPQPMHQRSNALLTPRPCCSTTSHTPRAVAVASSSTITTCCCCARWREASSRRSLLLHLLHTLLLLLLLKGWPGPRCTARALLSWWRGTVWSSYAWLLLLQQLCT